MILRDKSLRVHLTNVTGLGAVQLVKSLLPALEATPGMQIEEIYLPGQGELSTYERRSIGSAPRLYRRLLPNAVSRLLECTVLGGQFDGAAPLLVLGDLPIRCRTRQVVFVQQLLLTDGGNGGSRGGLTKAVSRLLFRINLRYASSFIVQTGVMRAALLTTYPELAGKVHVVAQPVPSWLLDLRSSRIGRRERAGSPLHLVYPAGSYAHKNHRLLRAIDPSDAREWPVHRLILTIEPSKNPNDSISWLECVGVLTPGQMLRQYGMADALVFLSMAESYGFPLVEAMWVGLPIICPDLAYARALCGDEAIYFDPSDIASLRAAITELHVRLETGWWPCWAKRLEAIPVSWDAVAVAMCNVASAN